MASINKPEKQSTFNEKDYGKEKKQPSKADVNRWENEGGEIQGQTNLKDKGKEGVKEDVTFDRDRKRGSDSERTRPTP